MLMFCFLTLVIVWNVAFEWSCNNLLNTLHKNCIPENNFSSLFHLAIVIWISCCISVIDITAV